MYLKKIRESQNFFPSTIWLTGLRFRYKKGSNAKKKVIVAQNLKRLYQVYNSNDNLLQWIKQE
jgi:hypothetical protein